MSTITVIITTHNLEKYLEQCLNGLLQQTIQDFEILIVDDASTDETQNIIKKWVEKDSLKIKTIILDKNLGAPGLVRNVALESDLIDGEYVLFLDGDDICKENMLEKMYNAAKSSGSDTAKADIVICAYKRVEQNTGKTLAVEMQGFPNEITNPSENDRIAFINTAPWNKLWKKEIIQDLRFADYKAGEEVLFSYKAYRNSHRIVFINEPLIDYMVRKDSVISNTDESTIWAFAESLKKEWLLSEKTDKLLELIIFLHIGLSMALRAADNSDIYIHLYIQRIEKWFKNELNWFKANRLFSISSLIKHGIKGIIIWLVFHMYKFHVFEFALFLYRKLKLNVKF